MAESEGVWRLICHRNDIHVRLVELPDEVGGGVLSRRADGQVWILLDGRLSPTERRAVLLHELVHLERGSARWEDAPPGWDAVVAREEQAVDRAVAKRLVPEDELAAFVRRCLSIRDYVTAVDVADEFGVPVEVAERACRQAS